MSLMPLLFLGAVLPAQVSSGDNLDFRAQSLVGWEGSGFYLTSADPRGPSLTHGVCSSDGKSPTGRGWLCYTFTLPAGIGFIRFTACATRPRDHYADQRLDVVLSTADGRIVPKQIRSGTGWVETATVWPRLQGKPREYAWNVSALSGQTLQIVLRDDDPRPGCHLFCSGFQLLPLEEAHSRDFARHMVALQKEHNLAPMARYDTKRFTALSNADENFTIQRMRNCELIYDLFFEHFRKRGFTYRPPTGKLMLAIFDSPKGFHAYLGMKLSLSITGMYHRDTNRLTMYDQHQNPALLARRNVTLMRDENMATIMHEVAHQLSFNCGLLNRFGDAPLWLVEGLACYCEPTQDGEWQGIGAVNGVRVASLTKAKLLPLASLLRSDDWRLSNQSLTGYAQSWALFRMLMADQPQVLRAYLARVYPRRTPDYRLADFIEAFGDVAALERKHFAYIHGLLN